MENQQEGSVDVRMTYFFREREDGKFDVYEGSLDEEGRIVTTLDTEEEAWSYIDEVTQADQEDVVSKPDESKEQTGMKLGGWRWSDMAEAAIRLGGWRWSGEETETAAGISQTLLGGWRWSGDPKEFAALLGGWRWSQSDDPVESLAGYLRGGWRWVDDEDAQEAAVRLLGGWRWSTKLIGGWRWSEGG